MKHLMSLKNQPYPIMNLTGDLIFEPIYNSDNYNKCIARLTMELIIVQMLQICTTER